MEFSGSQTFKTSKENVWAYLLDVNKVAECAPGFQSLEVLEDEHWKAVIGIGVGPVKAKFTLDVTREMRPQDYMLVKGRGKAPGSGVELFGHMDLVSIDAHQTRMDWTARVLVSGTIASVGARLLSSAAEKLTGQFFSCLETMLRSSEAASAGS